VRALGQTVHFRTWCFQWRIKGDSGGPSPNWLNFLQKAAFFPWKGL